MSFSKDKMKKMVFAELGGSATPSALPIDAATVSVELTDEQFDTALIRAKSWFSAKKGFVVYRPINVNPNIVEYKMKSDVINVLDVYFNIPSDVAAFFSLGFFDLIPYGPQSIGNITANTASYSGFAQLLSYNEERKRVFSVEPDWIYDQQTKNLNLIVRQGAVQNNMAIVKAKLGEFDPSVLDGWDADIFYRYLLAKCKEIVGRIRSKYDSMPSAGGVVTLDGKSLIEESKIEIEELNKEIFASQGPDEPVVG